MKSLPVAALTAEAFAPYGQVIEASEAARHFPINGGSTERYHDLAQVELAPGSHPLISIFRAKPRQLPYRIGMLERHPLGSQAFVPMNGRAYLVAVAIPGEQPRSEDVRVFLARGDQGVNYAAGVWHHPLMALEAVSDFLVVDRGGPGNNCDEQNLPEPLQVLTACVTPD